MGLVQDECSQNVQRSINWQWLIISCQSQPVCQLLAARRSPNGRDGAKFVRFIADSRVFCGGEWKGSKPN